LTSVRERNKKNPLPGQNSYENRPGSGVLMCSNVEKPHLQKGGGAEVQEFLVVYKWIPNRFRILLCSTLRCELGGTIASQAAALGFRRLGRPAVGDHVLRHLQSRSRVLKNGYFKNYRRRGPALTSRFVLG